MILVGVDSKEKAFVRFALLRAIFFLRLLKASFQHLQKNKALPLSREGFFFCRGGRITHGLIDMFLNFPKNQ
jgi:hypothetical protein